jgi:hypothetical protein
MKLPELVTADEAGYGYDAAFNEGDLMRQFERRIFETQSILFEFE